jgi:hypothetical protein
MIKAWWWYYLTKERLPNPAGRAQLAHRLPEGFLALTRFWPFVAVAHRAQIEQMLLAGQSANDLAAFWSALYPELTPDAFAAFMALYLSDHEQLGEGLNGQLTTVGPTPVGHDQ